MVEDEQASPLLVSAEGPLDPAAVLAEVQVGSDVRSVAAIHREIAGELKLLFAESPPSWWPSFPVDPRATAEQTEAEVIRLEAGTEMAPFVRQMVHLLTGYPPRPDFSDRLRQIAWAFVEPLPEPGRAERILALMNRLPKSDDNHWEGVGLRGDLLVLQDRPAAAAELYRKALADEATPPIYASLAAERFAEAARIFARLEPKGDLEHPWFAESLARATLLALEQGREKEAWRYLRRLAPVADAVAAESPYADQILGLRRLAGHEAWARQAWEKQKTWWPEWLGLGERLGYRPSGKPVTQLANPLQVSQQVAALVRQNQPGPAFAALEGVAHAARWDPAMAVSLTAALAPLTLSARRDEVLAFQARMLSILPPAPTAELQAMRLLMLSASLVDRNRPGEALAPLREALALGVPGQLSQRAAGLLALAALGSGESLEEARDLLSRALDVSYPPEDRGQAVKSLADLYVRLGQSAELLRLLEREAANPVLAGTAELAEIESRLAAVRQGGQGDLFDLAWAEFQQRHLLPILDVAEPESLADPRASGKPLADLFKDTQWLPAERAKLAYLIAADRRRPIAEKSDALTRMQAVLDKIVPDQKKYREMLQAMAGEKRFPAVVRAYANFRIGASWAQLMNRGELEKFLARQDLELELRFRKMLELNLELLTALEQGPETLESWVSGLLARRFEEAEATIFGRAWSQLIVRAGPEAAKRLLPRLEALETAQGPELADQLRLKAERALDVLSEGRQILDLLRRKVPGAAQPLPRPALMDEVLPGDRLTSLGSAQCRQILYDDLHQPSLEYAPFATWMFYYRLCQERGDGSAGIALGVLQAILDAGFRDATQEQWLTMVAATFSGDEPLWPELLETVGSRVGARDLPETRKRLRTFEIQRQLRAGRTIDFEVEKAAVQAGDRSFLRAFEAEILLRNNDLAAAKTFLASHSPAELKESFGLEDRLSLALRLPESPEKKWLEKAARREIYESRLNALATCSATSAVKAIRLTRILGEGNGYGQEWFDLVFSCQENAGDRAELALRDAEARQDWQKAYDGVRELIAIGGPDQVEQFHLGRAAFHLGKKEEAKAALTLFLNAVKNHPETRAAREMLALLEKKDP